MIRGLFILGICVALAFCAATVPLGKKTFFGHVKAIWSSEPMSDLKDGVKDTAGPATDKAKEFVKGGIDAVKKGSGSGSGSDSAKPKH
ncbi:MAG: hypothetical protein H0V17_07845 [Deltaproteobacteria bacterium]|nr:hypothetical protein [Deltaproteobacteria bacterium]